MFATESLQQEFVTSNICTYDKSGLTLPNTIYFKIFRSPSKNNES